MTLSKLISMAIMLATAMLLARFRTLEEYGTYSQLLLVISLFTTLFMLGLPNSINYFLARADTQEEKQRFLSVYYTLSTLLSILIGVILVLSVPLIEAFFHNRLIRSFCFFLVLYPWASIISSSIENVLVVYKRTRFLMLYRVVNSVALLASVVVVQWLGYGFRAYMIAFIAVNCLLALLVYLISSRLSGGIRILLDRSMIRTILAFSVPMGLASVVGTFNTEIDKLLISFLLDTEQMAIYTNAAKELPVTIVASSITAVLLPQLTRMLKRGQRAESVALWGYAAELSFIIICFITAGVFTYANEALAFLYSAKYLPGVSVFRVYTLNLLLRITYFGIILNATGETKKIFWCSILSLLLNVILNPLFYLLLGMIGPAVATFLAILLIQLLQLKMTSNVTDIPFCRIFPWSRLFRVALINLVFALVFGMIKYALPLERFLGEIPESILLGLIWGAVYFLVMRRRLSDRWRMLNQGGASSE